MATARPLALEVILRRLLLLLLLLLLARPLALEFNAEDVGRVQVDNRYVGRGREFASPATRRERRTLSGEGSTGAGWKRGGQKYKFYSTNDNSTDRAGWEGGGQATYLAADHEGRVTAAEERRTNFGVICSKAWVVAPGQ